jgi:N-acetylmuramic acid 6-phosphate etherase
VRIEQPLRVSFDKTEFALGKGLACHFLDNLLLKMYLNAVSTLIMGRLGRYQGNVMTYVRATNFKLIDRVARNVLCLRKDLRYEDVIRRCFELKGKLRES